MTESEILRELAKELSLPAIEPDEVTVQALADSSGVGYHAARRFLTKKVAEGEMTFRRVRLPAGNTAYAYRKAE